LVLNYDDCYSLGSSTFNHWAVHVLITNCTSTKPPPINVVRVLFVARPPPHCHHIFPILVLVASSLSFLSSYLKSTTPLIVFLVLVVGRPCYLIILSYYHPQPKPHHNPSLSSSLVLVPRPRRPCCFCRLRRRRRRRRPLSFI